MSFLVSDTKSLIKATHFAAVAHCKQMRKDGYTPYINHPIGVANILTELGNVTDTDVIIAALLHDTVEDTDVTFDDIRSEFGQKIWFVMLRFAITKLPLFLFDLKTDVLNF